MLIRYLFLMMEQLSLRVHILNLSEVVRYIERYIIHSENDSYEWNLDLLFEDAFDGLNARTFSQLMAVAMRICHIQNKGLYYTLFRKAEQSGIILSVKNQETGETWVERKGEKEGYINNN